MLTRGTALAVVGGSLLGALAGVLSHAAAPKALKSAPPFTPVNAIAERAPPVWRETPRFVRPRKAQSSAPASDAAAKTTPPRRDDFDGQPPRDMPPVEASREHKEGEAAAIASGTPPPGVPVPEGTRRSPEGETSTGFPHWAPLGGPPATKNELTRLLVRCGQRDGRSCLAVSVAYKQGLGTPTDPKEADRFERVALYFLGRHCEQREPMACVDLGEMYRRGITVAVDNGRASFLLERARELCRIHATAGCADVPQE